MRSAYIYSDDRYKTTNGLINDATDGHHIDADIGADLHAAMGVGDHQSSALASMVGWRFKNVIKEHFDAID